MASLAAKVRAIYSALVDDSIIMGCFLEYQLAETLFSIKMKSDVNFQLFLSLAQLESQ